MVYLWRGLAFGFRKKQRQRYLRGLRLEMLVSRFHGGDIELVDDFLFQTGRATRVPVLRQIHGSNVLWLQVPVAKVRGDR